MFRHKRNRKSFWVVKSWFTIKNLEICVSVTFYHVIYWGSLSLGSRNSLQSCAWPSISDRDPPWLNPGEIALHFTDITQVIWKFVRMRFQITQLDAHISSQYVVTYQQLIDQILVVRWFSFQKKLCTIDEKHLQNHLDGIMFFFKLHCMSNRYGSIFIARMSMDPCPLDFQLRLYFEPSMKSLHSSSLYCVKPIASTRDFRSWKYTRPSLEVKNWKNSCSLFR